MEVHIYKAKAGRSQVLVRPALASGKQLVLLNGVTRGTLRAQVLPILEALQKDGLSPAEFERAWAGHNGAHPPTAGETPF